jgi:hypothetical protein
MWKNSVLTTDGRITTENDLTKLSFTEMCSSPSIRSKVETTRREVWR